jgi:hypothetical protein
MMPSEHGQELRAPPCMHRSNLGPHPKLWRSVALPLIRQRIS